MNFYASVFSSVEQVPDFEQQLFILFEHNFFAQGECIVANPNVAAEIKIVIIETLSISRFNFPYSEIIESRR